MSSIQIGVTSVLTVDNQNDSGIILAMSAVLSQDAILNSLSMYVKTADGNLRLAVYDDSGTSGGPGALKAETASTAATGPDTWNELPVITPVLLPADTYWLAWQLSSNSLVNKRESSGGSHAVQNSFTYGAFPGTFTISSTGSNRWSVYATLETSLQVSRVIRPQVVPPGSSRIISG